MKSKMYALALNPWIVLAAMVAGASLGIVAPALALQLGFIGDIYVDLLKMIVLPFMVSAVIFSLQRLRRAGGAGNILKRTSLVFGIALVVVAVLGVAAALLVQGAGQPSSAQMEQYGLLVGQDTNANDTLIELDGGTKVVDADLSSRVRAILVPTNVFAALANGETLKALMFSLLFGLAMGSLPGSSAAGLSRGLEAVYLSCQHLTKWLNYPLPLVLLCMCASQMAKTGIGPLGTMLSFIGMFGLASLMVLALAVLLLWSRGGLSPVATLNCLRAPFALAVATRSSATCMPAMIETLADDLRLSRERVELLVPLSISLLRLGPVLYYVCATLFIAHIYGRALSPSDLALVGAASILAGCASAGMTGLVTVSLTGMACGYLGLPFEAAFVLFLAVDPLCDMLRTVVLVIGSCAAVALICDQPIAGEIPAAPSMAVAA